MEFPFLKGFLSPPPYRSRPSVWDLKQFLAINDLAHYSPILLVKVDYGFINCQKFREIESGEREFEEMCVLIKIYKRLLLKANLLDVHAYIAGNLFEFA
jgi:hypothetical protein